MRLPGSVNGICPGQSVAIECLPVQPGRLVPDANCLQVHRGDNPPKGRGLHLLTEPAGVLQVAPDPRPDGIEAVKVQVKPQLERSEPTPEREALVPVLGHAAVGR
jgi:hypothetical protein